MTAGSLGKLIKRLGPTSVSAFEAAAASTMAAGHYVLEVEHLLVALLQDPKSDVAWIAEEYGLDRPSLIRELTDAMRGLDTGNERTPSLSPSIIKMLEDAWLLSSLEHDTAAVRSGYLLLALLRDGEARAHLCSVSDAWAVPQTEELSERLQSMLGPEASAVEAAPYKRVDGAGQNAPASTTPPSGGSTRDVFLSYAREDREAAARIAASLETLGITVWYDVQIPTGRTFSSAIDDALTACRCVVVLWSKASVESNWVLEEAGEGLERGILAPTLIDDVPLPRGFRRIQAADLISWAGDGQDPAFRRLAEDIKSIAGVDPRD